MMNNHDSNTESSVSVEDLEGARRATGKDLAESAINYDAVH